MPRSSILTLQAIAEEAGVSRMTVSRVLRNAPYITPGTKERVLEAVNKVGYRPNPMVSAFMTYVRRGGTGEDAGVLAYLTSGARKTVWRSHHTYARFYEGAQARAQQRGYRLEEFWLGEGGMSSSRLSRILYAQGIRGIVTAPMSSSHGHLRMDWTKFSAAAIGYSLLKPFLHRASNDQYNSALIALRELRRLGYRRIGLAVPREDDERVHYHWSAAYLSFHQRWKMTKFPAPHLPRAWERLAFLGWVRQQRPDVVISTRPDPHGWLADAGQCVPADIGFVNLDWSDHFQPCAGIDQRPQEVGGAAVDLVVEQINHNEFGLSPHPRVVMLPGQWVPGPSIRSPRAGSVPVPDLAAVARPTALATVPTNP